jgi:ectoine hydroxylase-related dioxygenase (phytanoyl-CoA dioxygenase family)
MNPTCEALERTGLVVVRGVLSDALVASLRGCFAALDTRGVPTSRQVLYTHREPSGHRADFGALMQQWLNPHRLVGEGSTEEAMRSLRAWLARFAQRPLLPFQDVLLSKHIEHREFPWHQDEPFWPLDCVWGAVVWCALDPVGASNGAVEFAVGSHLGELGPAVDLHTGAAQEGSGGHLPDVGRFEVVQPTLDPGDAVIFHPRTFHRSQRNTSGSPRRAWASTWLSPDSRWNPARAPRHPLASRAAAGVPLGDVPLVGGVSCVD